MRENRLSGSMRRGVSIGHPLLYCDVADDETDAPSKSHSDGGPMSVVPGEV